MTLNRVFENADTVFDRNLGSELKEPSQISNELEVISQRLLEQNTKMTQIEEHLNSKFEEILKEVRVNEKCDVLNRERDVENSNPGPFSSENK